MFYTKWIFHSEIIQNPINKELKIKKNVDEMIDVLKDFLEPDNGNDDVDQGEMGST